MVHEQYVLKHSRLATVFQLLLFICITLIIYSLCHWIVSILLISLMIGFWMAFKRQPSIQSLQQLEADLWSIQFQHDAKVHRVRIHQMLDHGLYIMLYFEHTQYRSLIIWRDQVDVLAWKGLRTRVKLQ